MTTSAPPHSSSHLLSNLERLTPSFNPIPLKTTAFPSAPWSLPFSITESDFSPSTQPLVKGHQALALAHGSSLTALGKCFVTISSTDNWPPSWKRSLICSYGSEAFEHTSHQSPQLAFLDTCPAYWCPFSEFSPILGCSSHLVWVGTHLCAHSGQYQRLPQIWVLILASALYNSKHLNGNMLSIKGGWTNKELYHVYGWRELVF